MLGKKCFRAHGLLEKKFHPLLYKTKVCKSTIKNGRCAKFGILCEKAHKRSEAKFGILCEKAHKRSEVRKLVKIYVENWKLHYDISYRVQQCLTEV